MTFYPFKTDHSDASISRLIATETVFWARLIPSQFHSERQVQRCYDPPHQPVQIGYYPMPACSNTSVKLSMRADKRRQNLPPYLPIYKMGLWSRPYAQTIPLDKV
jgi:hypothetical protein